MRIVTSAFLTAAMMGLAACSDPECMSNEYKAGQTCYPKSTRTPDGSAATAEEGRVDSGRPEASGFDSGSIDSSTSIPATSIGDAGADSETLSTDAGDASLAPATPCTGGTANGGALNACGKCGPVPMEVCGDGVDNDCDGQTEEADATGAAMWYPDCDGDGFGSLAGIKSCLAPTSTANCKAYLSTAPVANITADCVDSSALYFPGPTNHGGGGWQDDARKLDLNCDGRTDISDYTLSNGVGETTYCAAATGSTGCGSSPCVRLVDSLGNVVQPSSLSVGTSCGSWHAAKLFISGTNCTSTDVQTMVWCK